MSEESTLECDDDNALMTCRCLDDIKQKWGFGQQHTSDEGLKKFGDRGVEGTQKEIGQLHNRKCFRSVRIEDMPNDEQQKAQTASAWLTEKRNVMSC